MFGGKIWVFLEVNPFCLWIVEAISIYRVKNFFFNEKLFTVYMSVNILMPENSDESKQKYVKFGYCQLPVIYFSNHISIFMAYWIENYLDGNDSTNSNY